MANKFIVSSMAVCAVGLLGSNVYAAEQTDTVKNNIIRICLEGIDEKDRLSVDFYNYLKEKNVSITEYESFSSMVEGDDDIYIYEINNGSIFYEEILFSHPKVKSLVDNLQEEYNTTNKTTLRNLAKRELLAKPNSLESLLKESLNKGYADKNLIFKSIFNREPNSKEKVWMGSIDTLKIAAYSGEINKRFAGKGGYDSFIDLTTEQINKINSGDGCRILVSKNADEEEISNAFYEFDMSYSVAQCLQLYASHEIAFNNNYRVFNNIQNAILPIFNIDIFVSLSESELEEIHSKSILDSRFNELKALENVLKKLIDKGLIEENKEIDSPTPPEEGNQNNNFVQENHPFVERYNYYKNNTSWKDIFNKLSQDIWRFFSESTFFASSSGNQRIYFSYKGKEYDTQISINNNILSRDVAKILSEQIAQKLNIKSINSTKKTMIFFDNTVNIIPIVEFSEEKENLSKMKESYKNIGISIYTKNQTNTK